jgi:hypothetical protein
MVVPTSGLRDGKIRKKDVIGDGSWPVAGCYGDESRKLVVETVVTL